MEPTLCTGSVQGSKRCSLWERRTVARDKYIAQLSRDVLAKDQGELFGNINHADCILSFWLLLTSLPDTPPYMKHCAFFVKVIGFQPQGFTDTETCTREQSYENTVSSRELGEDILKLCLSHGRSSLLCGNNNRKAHEIVIPFPRIDFFTFVVDSA